MGSTIETDELVADATKVSGIHKYAPADFGLDADRLRARFDFYVRRFS